MPAPQSPSPDPGQARRQALLEAAIAVFLRFGYRKTSMDEVARAAQLSRQGLYLHFATKEDLFRAAVEQLLEASLQEARAALRAAGLPLESRLVQAFDAWMGRHVGLVGTDASDLAEAAGTLVGAMFERYQAQFGEAVTRVISSSGLAAAYRSAGLSARQLADTLTATARGLKYSSPSREAFGRSFTVAVRALCLPLERGS